jgi:hypothetical protein
MRVAEKHSAVSTQHSAPDLSALRCNRTQSFGVVSFASLAIFAVNYLDW